MTRSLQEILEPVRHLNVFDRLATFGDKTSEYQVLVRAWVTRLSGSSEPVKVDIIGKGQTEELAAYDALRGVITRLSADIDALDSLRRDCVRKLGKP